MRMTRILKRIADIARLGLGVMFHTLWWAHPVNLQWRELVILYIYNTVYHDLLWYANGLLIFRSNMLKVVDGVKVQLRTDWDLITSTARRIFCQQKSSHWSFSRWSWIGPFHTSIHYIGNHLFLDLRTFTERWPKKNTISHLAGAGGSFLVFSHVPSADGLARGLRDSRRLSPRCRRSWDVHFTPKPLVIHG